MTLFLICIVVGVAAGFLTVTVMKNQLRSVRRQPNAAGYVHSEGLHLTLNQDVFLYQNTTRHPKPKSKK